MAKRILFICTSSDKIGSGTEAVETGCWAEEVAAPYYVFKSKGYEITIASIQGGEIPFDDASLNPPFLTDDAKKMLLDEEAMKLLTQSLKLEDVDAASFDAIFLPGGHGVVADLPANEELGKQLSAAYVAGKVISAVCHGPNGLVNIRDAAGDSIVKGRKVTGFSNTEEKAVAKEHLVPFLLEDKLKELGGSYERADDWHPFAVRDGLLVTGQNPQSSLRTAELVVEALSS